MSHETESIYDGVGAMLDDLEALYKDVHRHPELSMHETRTATLAAERLRAAGFEVTTGVGNTGVVGLLPNGGGPTVMLRADMDALPVEEQTGLDYASTADGVMHACGHDMHVAWLAGAAGRLSAARDEWQGTLMVVFQPAEETAQGAQAMIDDGLFDRFPKPDVVLGQHVMPVPAGSIGTCYIDALRTQRRGLTVTVVLPEVIVKHRWHWPLHNGTARRLRRALRRQPGVVITTVPLHLPT